MDFETTISVIVGLITVLIIIYDRFLIPPGNMRMLPVFPLWYGPYILLWAAPRTDLISRLDILKKAIDHANRNCPNPPIKDTYAVWTVICWTVLTFNPDVAKQMFLNIAEFPKYLVTDMAEDSMFHRFLGSNILLNNGAEWKRHRKIANQAFRSQFDTHDIGEVCKSLINIIRKNLGKPIEFHDYSQRLTMDVFGKAIFDRDLKCLEKNDGQLIKSYNKIIRILAYPVFSLFPSVVKATFIPLVDDILKNISLYDKLIYEMIEQKEKELDENDGLDAKDLMKIMILASRKDSEGGLTRQEIRNNASVFLLAGHDTTSNAISSALYFLAKHPQIQERVREEVNSIIGEDCDNLYIPNYEEQKRMEYLTCVLKETLRLSPSVGILPSRWLQKGKTKSVLDIPLSNGSVLLPDFGNAMMQIHILAMHYSDHYWENPREFNPERFIKNNSTSENDTMNYQWVPFGAGPRSCIGQAFSFVEQRVVVSMILRNFHVTLPHPSERIQYKPGILLGPTDDFALQFTSLTA